VVTNPQVSTSGDEVLRGVAAAAGAAAHDRVGLDLLSELLDLGRRGLEPGCAGPHLAAMRFQYDR
jgi:hypothetical protein